MWSALVGVYHSVKWKNARWNIKIKNIYSTLILIAKVKVVYCSEHNLMFSKDLTSSSSGRTSPTTRSSPAPTLEAPESNVMDSGTSSLRPRSSTVGTAEGEMMKHDLELKHSTGSLSASSSQQHLASVAPPNGQQRTSPMLNMWVSSTVLLVGWFVDLECLCGTLSSL